MSSRSNPMGNPGAGFVIITSRQHTQDMLAAAVNAGEMALADR